MPHGAGMGAVIAVMPALHAQEHQRVSGLVAQQRIVAKMPAEHEGVAGACRFQQVVACPADKHAITVQANQMIVAALAQQPACGAWRRDSAVPGPGLERVGVLTAGITRPQAIVSHSMADRAMAQAQPRGFVT